MTCGLFVGVPIVLSSRGGFAMPAVFGGPMEVLLLFLLDNTAKKMFFFYKQQTE
jgi:hypothetical protein